MAPISRKVLCVDDDAMVLEGLRRQLRKRFDVVTAAGGPAGLTVMAEQGPFAVVVSDYRMPGMDGVDFLRRARALSPETVLVMLTGQTELSVAVSALHEGHVFRFLTKPCATGMLEVALGDSLEQYRLVVSARLLRHELDIANRELRTLNDELERLVTRRTAAIEGLYHLVADLNALESLDEMARAIVRQTAEVLHSRRAALLMPDASGECLVLRATIGCDAVAPDQVRIPTTSPIPALVFNDAQCVVVNEAEELELLGDPDHLGELFKTPLAMAPLLTADGPAGVLAVSAPVEVARYGPDVLAALKAIAEASGTALLTQVRRSERDDARDATILALAKLAEHRDPETGAHLERVQCYCRLISETLARKPRYAQVITREFIETIVRSSPLHDIGKVGIPDHILLKPGKLDPEEFEIMKEHARIGGDTLRALVEQGRRHGFLQMGMEIAYNHHERFDGTGYPRGLAGEAIPLPARILALADVYDALTSRRVYKPPMPHAETKAIILAGRGRHFDPDVVSAFLERAAEFERLSRALAEPLPPAPLAEEAALRA